MNDTPHFIPPHGGYEQLLSYQKALVVFDGTKEAKETEETEATTTRASAVR